MYALVGRVKIVYAMLGQSPQCIKRKSQFGQIYHVSGRQASRQTASLGAVSAGELNYGQATQAPPGNPKSLSCAMMEASRHKQGRQVPNKASATQHDKPHAMFRSMSGTNVQC